MTTELSSQNRAWVWQLPYKIARGWDSLCRVHMGTALQAKQGEQRFAELPALIQERKGWIAHGAWNAKCSR